jgi:hypothetical protein
MLKIETLNYPILELAYVEQVLYEDPLAPGAYHLNVNLLIDLNGHETVVQLSGNVEQFRDILEPTTVVKVMTESGKCLRECMFYDLHTEHFSDLIDELVDNNDVRDLAAMYLERLTRREIDHMRGSIERDQEILDSRKS